MTPSTSEPGDEPTASADYPQSRGEAALLLIESLIHALVDKGVLTLREAVELVEIAGDVELEVAASKDSGKPPREQPSFLEPLARSLRGDLPD